MRNLASWGKNKKVAISFSSEKEASALRESGIEVIGAIPWGTHLCQFYETKDDLLDVLVPYMKAGLENNEFCMWITSEPLREEEAKKAIEKAVPNFDRYLKRGQIEIVPHTEWYLKDGVFNLQRVLNAWIDKLDQALVKGYDGIRVTGNTAWLEKQDWKNFTDYEEEVNQTIGNYRIMAICTYSLAKCKACEVIDVVRNHRFALIRRGSKWETIESSDFRQAKKVLRESEERFRNIFESASDCMIYLDSSGRVLDVNRKAVEVFGGSKKELFGKHFARVSASVVSPRDLPRVVSGFVEGLADKKPIIDLRIKNKKGQEIHLECTNTLLKTDNKFAGLLVIARDVTDRKQMEERIQSLARFPDENPNPVLRVDQTGIILFANKASWILLDGWQREVGGRVPAFWQNLVNEALRSKSNRNIETMLGENVYSFFVTPIVDFGYVNIYGMDITERKEAEVALLAERDRLETVTKNIGAGLAIISKDYRTLWANEVLKQIFGDVEGKICYSTYNKRNEVCPECGVREVFETGKDKVVHEQVGKDIDRKTVWSEIAATPIRDKDGNITAVLELVVPITERKKAEETLRESEEKYRNLFENARDLILTVDLEGNITSANRMVEEYGYDQSSIIGKNWFNLAPTEYLQQFRDGFLNLAHGKQKEGEIKIFSRRKQDYVTVEYRSNPIIQDNKVVGIQVIIRDITERKKLEEKIRQYSDHLEELVQKRTDELLESEKRYSILVEEASDGVAILQDEKVVFANKKLEETLGYSKGKLIGLSLEKIVDEKYLQLAKKRHSQKLLRELTPETTEYELITRTGECVPVEVTGARLDYQSRGATLVVVRDIRERKRMEEQRLKLEKLATMGELATMVAHDLRNPLTSIRNAGFYIKNSCPTRATGECKTALAMLDIIDQEIIFADNIINDLLDFAAQRPLQKKRQNINKIIDDSLTKNSIPENIDVQRNFAKKAVANVDEKQLERVLLNLVKNAVQAMPKGGQLTITTNETKDHVEITFTDTGEGIPEENMSKIFQPLFTTKAKGIGMGLAICKKIVEQHRGTIDFKSMAGQGTTFVIKLPKKEEANNQ